MPRWTRPLLLVVALVGMIGACTVACPALAPERVTLATITARIRIQESHLIDEAGHIIADPNSQTSFDNLQRPIVARYGGSAVVGWRWVDGIPAKSYGPVYDPDGLLERFPSGLEGAGLAFTGCTPLYGPWWYCRLY